MRRFSGVFKRRHDYLMQMDIEVNEDLVAGALELFRGKYPDAVIREMAIDSLMRHVLGACEG